jgi:signal transduction histidine kinase
MTQQECSDFGWARVLHPGERDRTIEAWKECVRTEGVWDVEHRFLGVDGNYHHVLARGAPVRDDNGRLICWAGINLDITGLRKAQQEQLGLYESLRRNAQQLAETNRQLEQFAFAASHDLQEPLRTINIYTELLLREIGPGLTENTRRFAGFIQSAVKRQQRLIADLLAYSRAIHSDELVADSQADAARALGHAVEALKPALDESGAELHIDSLPVVSCDEAQLTQVFQNLLGNAIKYRDESRPLRIAVRCLHSGACCTFSVEDNGIGFSQAYAEQIFGLFKRLHRERYPGTGLGLAMCRRVVERYGGRIWAESQPGEGSTFRFTLPLPRSADTKPSESELTSAEDTRNLITDR